MSVVKKLVKQLGDFQLNIPEWEIADQGVTLIWGPSGSGKTSTIRTLLGLEPCPQMQWWFGEEDIAQKPAYERNIGVVFQSLSLFPHLTVRENILFRIEARGEDVSEEKLTRLISFFGLSDLIDRKARHLSGGEKQKVALARALMSDPPILILDEPFSALDLQYKKQARQLLKKIAEERRIPILLVSHDPIDAEQLAQRVVTFEKGQIKTSQSPEDFLKHGGI